MVKKCGHRGCEKKLYERKKYCSEIHKYRESCCRKESTSGWGNKNSQMRLDKKASRFAKRIKTGGTVRFN